MSQPTTVHEITVKYDPPKRAKNYQIIKSSKDAYACAVQFFPENIIQLQEHFAVLYLNRANKVIGGYKISIGGITSTVVDIRLILSVALKTLATGLILVHNHPSGNLKPSKSDEEITIRVKEAAKLMDIQVLDHIILVSGGEYYSFADEGLV